MAVLVGLFVTNKIKGIGSALIIVLVSFFVSCESDWPMFIFRTRGTVIYVLLANFAIIFIKKLKLRVKK